MQQGDKGPDHLIDLQYAPHLSGLHAPATTNPTDPAGGSPPQKQAPLPTQGLSKAATSCGPKKEPQPRSRPSEPSEGWRRGQGWGRKTRTRSPGKVISGLEVMVSLARAWAAFVCPTSVPSRASGSRAYIDKPFGDQDGPGSMMPKLSCPDTLTVLPSPFSSSPPRPADQGGSDPHHLSEVSH